MDSTATDLFNLLVSRDYTVKTLTSQGKPEVNPGEAEMFSFDFETSRNNYGTVVILLDDENNFEVYYGDNVGKNMEGDDKDAWYDFLNQLKTFATRNLLTFTLKNLNKLKYSMQGMAAINEGLFEGWNGTKHTSYNNKPGTTRLKIVHSKAIEEGEQRFRNIEKLYVENAEGERFKLPFTSLVAGRAMARHVAEGGTPYDVFGQHITEMVREANVLAKFTQATRAITEDDVEQFSVAEAGRERYKTLRQRLKSLAGKRGYHAYKETWDPATIEDGVADANELHRIFTRETIDPRIEEAFPYLTTVTQESNMNESSLWDLNQKFLKKGQKTRAAIEKFFNDHGYPVHTSSTGAGLRTHNGAVFVLQNWPSQGNVLSYLQHNSRPDSPDRKDIINIMKNYGNVMSQPGNESVYGIAFKNGNQALEILQAVDALTEPKESTMKEFDKFANWADSITEGTWAIPDDEAKIKKLKEILAEPLPVGTDAMNATSVLYDVIGDDELFDSLAALAEDDPEADARPVIEHWLEMYTDAYPGLEDLADRVLGGNEELEFDEAQDFGARGMNKYGMSAIKTAQGFFALLNGKVVAGPFASLEELKAYQEEELNKDVNEQLDIDTGKEQRKQERDAMLEMNAWRKLAGMQEKVYEDFTAFQEPQQQVEETVDTPLRDREDFLVKSKELYNMLVNPDLQDVESQREIQSRILRLEKEAREMGIIETTEQERANSLEQDILGELDASDLGKEGVDWFAPSDTEPYDPERDDPRDDPNYGFDRKPTKPQPTIAPGATKTQEGNAFSGALAQAKKSGKAEFEVDGKRYKVEEVDAGKFGQQDDELGQGKNTDSAQIVPGHADVKDEKLEEKWGTETKVSPSEKGKYEGKSATELRKAYNKLKASGPHEKGSKEYGKMRELAFAIRAKTGWGKVSEAGKPDYLDLDKDGDKEEPMKKAAQDAKKKDDKELDERSLTKGEETKREKYVKGMKKSKADFKKRYGKRGEEVMYATATKMAKESEGATDVFGKGIYESLTELENDLDMELGHGITATSQLDKKPVDMIEPEEMGTTDIAVVAPIEEPKEKNLGDKIADKGMELSATIDAALADIKRLAGMGN